MCRDSAAIDMQRVACLIGWPSWVNNYQHSGSKKYKGTRICMTMRCAVNHACLRDVPKKRMNTMVQTKPTTFTICLHALFFGVGFIGEDTRHKIMQKPLRRAIWRYISDKRYLPSSLFILHKKKPTLRCQLLDPWCKKYFHLIMVSGLGEFIHLHDPARK